MKSSEQGLRRNVEFGKVIGCDTMGQCGDVC